MKAPIMPWEELSYFRQIEVGVLCFQPLFPTRDHLEMRGRQNFANSAGNRRQTLLHKFSVVL